MAGLSYSYQPWRTIRFEGALGYGFTGVQLSFMPQLTLGTASNRFITGLGLGLAVGPSLDGDMQRSPLAFLNADIAGYEHRFQNGLSIYFAAGLTVLAAGDYCMPFELSHRGGQSCQTPPDWAEARWVPLPQARFGLGYSF